ncbi:MAG: hypothetical protein RLW62_15065, partial [Gammaproteobacteria bacterium]
MLGVSDELVEITDRATLAALCVSMVAQCRRRLDIASRHLDPAVYDDEAFVAAVKAFVLGSRQARVRLFVTDSRPLVSRGHRLVELATRLSSYIELRGPAPQHKDFNEALLLADNQGYIQRRFSDRFEGQANFSDRRVTAALVERFDEMWERGTPDPYFGRLHLCGNGDDMAWPMRARDLDCRPPRRAGRQRLRLAGWILALGMLAALPAGAADGRVTEILPLRHALLDDVVPLLRELVSPGGTVTGMHDRLVIRTTPENLAELRGVLNELDRAPRRLRISVRQDSGAAYRWREDELAARVRAGDVAAAVGAPRGGPGASIALDGADAGVRYRSYATTGSDDSAQAHFVSALEGRPAWIGAGRDVPLANRQLLATPGGVSAWDSVTYTHVGSGFYVTPRLAGDAAVTLEIAPYADSQARGAAAITRRGVATVVRGRLGEWLPLGGAGHSREHSGGGIVYRTRDSGSD